VASCVLISCRGRAKIRRAGGRRKGPVSDLGRGYGDFSQVIDVDGYDWNEPHRAHGGGHSSELLEPP
jgi:hypothetical protein